MRDLLIYTGGAIQYFLEKGECDFYKASCWRENFRTMLSDAFPTRKIEIYDPTIYFFERHKYSDETIIDHNTYYLRKSDILVVNTFHLPDSPGTMAEIDYFYRERKPRVGFNDHEDNHEILRVNKNLYTKAMLTEHFKSLDEVIKYIEVCFYC